MFKNRREYFAPASTNNCEITDIHIALIQNVKFALINKRVYSWGSTNEMGLQGRETSVSTPTLIQNLPAIGSIAGDINTMFAVATNGDVYGWGSNADNLLTPEAITNVTTPIKIQGLSNIVKISVASVEPKSVNPQNPQLCICALDTIGNVYMWGNNKGNHF
jgi:alpha-tubulin suppressor-like RCC1 family protein